MDEDVRQRLAAGQFKEAFERLVELYSRRVFHLAFSMLRNETKAEDTTQDIFLRIWKGLPGYRGGASLSTWIYAIARNTCLSELKRQESRPTVSMHEPELAVALEGLAAFQTTDRETGVGMDVHQMLDQLPEKYRRVVMLFYLEQKSYEEVSALLHLPLGTVKTFLWRAKKQLLQILHRLERVTV